MKGIAYDYPGINAKDRDLVENGFSNEDIRILCTCAPLPSDVNRNSYKQALNDSLISN